MLNPGVKRLPCTRLKQLLDLQQSSKVICSAIPKLLGSLSWFQRYHFIFIVWVISTACFAEEPPYNATQNSGQPPSQSSYGNTSGLAMFQCLHLHHQAWMCANTGLQHQVSAGISICTSFTLKLRQLSGACLQGPTSGQPLHLSCITMYEACSHCQAFAAIGQQARLADVQSSALNYLRRSCCRFCWAAMTYNA